MFSTAKDSHLILSCDEDVGRLDVAVHDWRFHFVVKEAEATCSVSCNAAALLPGEGTLLVVQLTPQRSLWGIGHYYAGVNECNEVSRHALYHALLYVIHINRGKKGI